MENTVKKKKKYFSEILKKIKKNKKNNGIYFKLLKNKISKYLTDFMRTYYFHRLCLSYYLCLFIFIYVIYLCFSSNKLLLY